MRNKNKIERMNWFDYINYTVMFLFLIITVYPVWYVLIGSFNQGLDYVSGGVYFFPRLFDLHNYMIVFADNRLWHAFGITVAKTVVGCVTAVAFTAIVAYAMSRKVRFKKALWAINLFTMFFGGGLIPYFLVIKTLGLYNNFLVFIIPSLYSVYNMIVMQRFFQNIPEELHESAEMDGAGEFRIFAQIYLPLSTPVLATVALWAAIGQWNSFFDTMVYTSSEDLWSLQYFLMMLNNQASLITDNVPIAPDIMETISAKTISYAAIIVSIVPIVCIYPFLTKFFEKGILIGSVKG